MPSLGSRVAKALLRRQMPSWLEGDRPISESRARINALAERWIHPPKGIVVRPVLAGGVPSEWLERVEGRPSRVILYLHGGGYTICSPATHRGLAGRIALSAGARLLSIDYRLAPEHPYPAALEDALATYQWMLAQGARPDRIAMGGDSAGGGLTLAASVSLKAAGLPLPAALFLISPWTDLTFSGESHRTLKKIDPIFQGEGGASFGPAYTGQFDPALPLISPLFADLRGLPPTLIQVGSDEILLSDSTRLEEKMEAEGVHVDLQIWEGMWHVFQAFAPWLPESRHAVNRIGRFMRTQIGEEA
ncbi:MAG: alpha/beta hydrolase [Anaerolineales bacterium]